MTKVSPIQTTQPQTQKKDSYRDPLNSWKFKWMSYSDEAGVAISEIAPRLGAALWVPTFMYMGADIYDKYKNNKDKYDPSSKRALERTIYQGISNIAALPLLIAAGQRLTSPLGKLSKSRISVDEKVAIYNHINQVLEQGVNKELNNEDAFKKLINRTLDNKISRNRSEYKHDNIFKKIFKFLKNDYTFALGDKDKLQAYAQVQAKELFDIHKALSQGQHSKKISPAVLKKYYSTLGIMKEMHGYDYAHNAGRAALIRNNKNSIFKNKMIKTAGGFTALVLLGSTISKYVEKTIVGKYVNTGLTYAYNNFTPLQKKKAFEEVDVETKAQ